MKHANSRELYNYWRTLRHSRTAPLRSEVEPRAIKSVLRNLFILQRLSDDDYTFRLAGTGLCRQFGRELKNENFLSNWQRNEAASLRALFGSVTTDRTAAVLGATAACSDDTQVALEYLFVPVRLDASREIRILGCCSRLDREDRFRDASIVRQNVASLRLLWPGENSRFLDGQAPQVLGENLARTAPAPQLDAQQHGHLRVIEGGAE